jgi:hypothetical protein
LVTELLSRRCSLAIWTASRSRSWWAAPKLFGFSVDGTGLRSQAWGLCRGWLGETNRAALAVGLAGIVVILGLRRLWSGSLG